MPADKERKTFDGVNSANIKRYPRLPDPLDYGTVLADLQAKRDALDQVISSLQVASASGALIGVGDAMSPMTDGIGVSLRGGEIPQGAFLGKSIAESAKLCLQITKRKMTTREIVDALKKGGIETTAKTSFPSIVHSILLRSVRTGGGIVKLDRSTWGLAEWYPASLRSATSSSKARKRSKGSHAAKPVPVASKSDSIPKKVRDALKTGLELSAQEVAEKAGTKSNVAAMLLGGMVKSGSAEKTASGKFRAVKTAA